MFIIAARRAESLQTLRFLMSTNLPIDKTPFVGRRREVADLDALLQDPECRLVTILGPGGIGKTRLAVELARSVAGRFDDGLVYVDLQSLTNAHYLAETIAEGSGLQLVGDQTTEQLIRFLKNRELLLLLDNFEQPPAGANLISVVLSAAPAVRFVVTSREVLNLQEEWLYPLHGLGLPQDVEDPREAVRTSEAVQLYIQRASRVRLNFDVDADPGSVIRICELVEGMPLAIELAASWSRVMDAKSIAHELEIGLGILATSMRNMPDRHRSIYATLNQSWQRLNESQQRTLAQLSVFHGGFRREQAELVTGASLSLLAQLMDQSLLNREPEGRYAMHELVRKFAADKLSDDPDLESFTRERHAEAYAAFLHARAKEIFGHRQHDILEEIRPELANVLAAQQWGMDRSDVEILNRLVYGYYIYCDYRGHYRQNTEVLRQMVRRLVEMDSSPEVLQSLAACYAYLGWCYIRLGQLETSVAYSERAQAILTEFEIDPASGFDSEPLAALALAYHVQGNYEKALTYAMEAHQRTVERDDESNLMIADYVLCNVYLARNDLEQARSYGQNAASLAHGSGNSWFHANVLTVLGAIAESQGDVVRARQLYQESYALKEGAVDPEGMAVALNKLGELALKVGDSREAKSLHDRSLALYERISDPGGRAITHQGLGNAAAAEGHVAQAAIEYTRALEIMLAIQYWPRALRTLVDVAEFLAAADRVQEAMILLQAVPSHPSADAPLTERIAALSAEVTVEGNPTSAPLPGDESVLDLPQIIADTLSWLSELTADERRSSIDKLVLTANQKLIEPLTERELEVLQLLSDGRTNPQIAEELTISIGTVKSYTAHIYGKLAVRNRTQASKRARELGLLR